MSQGLTKASSADRRITLSEGIAWCLLLLFAFLYTFQFDDPLPVYEFGPAHWPRVILFGMLLAAAWLLYTETWLGIRQEPTGVVEGADTISDEDLPTVSRTRIVLIFGLPLLYTYLIHKLGFILVTPFFLFCYMIVMGVRRIRTLIIITVCLYTAILIIFVKLIFTYLPPGVGIFHTINGTIVGWLS